MDSLVGIEGDEGVNGWCSEYQGLHPWAGRVVVVRVLESGNPERGWEWRDGSEGRTRRECREGESRGNPSTNNIANWYNVHRYCNEVKSGGLSE